MAGAGTRFLGGVALLLAPLAAHAAMRVGAPSWLVLGVAAAQIGAVCAVLGRRRWWLAVPGIAGVAMLGEMLPARAVGLATAGLCHAMAYGGLLAWFAGSLRPGREPVITSLARKLRTTMPERVVRYTRRVTQAWCVFFAAELAASGLLLVAAPAWVWSGFVNTANLPLIGAMMLGELALRHVLFRHEQPTGLVATLAGLRGWRSARP